MHIIEQWKFYESLVATILGHSGFLSDFFQLLPICSAESRAVGKFQRGYDKILARLNSKAVFNEESEYLVRFSVR